MTSEQKNLLLQRLHANYEGLLNGAYYLFFANGAGVVGCLALLKDYATTSQYHGVGFYIIAFSSGLFASISCYICFAFSRAIEIKAVMDGVEVNRGLRLFLTVMSVMSLIIALGVLLLALATLMTKFAFL